MCTLEGLHQAGGDDDEAHGGARQQPAPYDQP